MNKNILIISHERSGTHFLLNSIAFNFPQLIDSNRQIDAPWQTRDLAEFEYFFVNNSRQETRQVFKSHHQIDFYKDFIGDLVKKYHVFYIVRDGRDVLNSCFHYFNKCPDGFPHTKNVGELMRVTPALYAFDNAYSWEPQKSMVDRWVYHAAGWAALSQVLWDNIHYIKYENLLNHFEATMAWIASIILPNKQPYSVPVNLRRPTLKDFGVSNRKGIAGDWKEHFTTQDRVYFNFKAKEVMNHLGYKI